ncbi:N-acetyltransferase family protein [Aestuariibaculum sp. YM273]|uniref:GNAT family N-acetyltransferase n=1 Tax=Aestuariibaculum sp. YM273 TaxID=3070659 RepID=UPI0027DAE8F7|nr:GNAT family N-acetyltransferase [Aestuariibaculum sp. YM273]WMI65793.1 N-acetyltransferase family protein [Aestuariibaculum sp. YM273]
MIRPVNYADAQQLLNIYNYYVINTDVTFDLEPTSLKAFQEKLHSITKDYPFIVYEENGEILGYAYAGKFRERPAYNSTLESTVYVKHNQHGKQIGSMLYAELLSQLKQTDCRVVLGVLTLPNEASVKLHEKFDFEKVGHLKEVGFKFNTWLDVGIFELKLA